MTRHRKFVAACILGFLASSLQGAPQAAELIILTNQGATPGVIELGNAFSRTTGHKVSVIPDDGLAGGAAVADPRSPALNQRFDSGPADLITATPEQIEQLAKQGKIVCPAPPCHS